MSEKPKEGIYLDAALAVIGEQIDERIDALSRRRRRWSRVGVAALAVVAVASGSVAAYAITSAVTQPHPVVAAPAPTVEGEVRCVDGIDPRAPAYFTASYRITKGEELDAVVLCTRAHDAMLGAPARYTGMTPAQAVASAVRLAGPGVSVDRASFGIAVASGSSHGLCRDRVTEIVLSSTAPSTDWAALCATAGLAGVSR